MALLLCLLCAAAALPALADARDAVAAARAAVPPPNFLLQWGGPGIGERQFDDPRGLAVDRKGDVYVCDCGNDRVQKFTNKGDYLGQWGSTGGIPDSADGHLSAPFDIAVSRPADPGAEQRLYVADTIHNRVQKFSLWGAFLGKWGEWGSGAGQFKQPTGIAVGPSGCVYVTDSLNWRVQKFSPDGAFLAQWGGHVDRGGCFRSPQGIAVDSKENVYVADYGVPAVLKFSSSGTLLARLTTFGSGDVPQVSPHDVAVDSNYDNIFVCEDTRVRVFSAEGRPLAQWALATGSSLVAPGGYGIAVAPSGEVYVGDSNFDCVKKYATSGGDKTPPKTTVQGVDDLWHNHDVTLTYTTTDEGGGLGVAYTQTSVEIVEGSWGAWQPGSTFTLRALTSHVNDGERLVRYRSVDFDRNEELPHVVTVRIDTVPPRVTVLPLKPSKVKKGAKVVVRFSVAEQLCDKVRLDMGVYSSALDKLVLTRKTGWVKVKRTSAYTWSFTCAVAPGEYSVWVGATDEAGNEGEADRTPLTVTR